MVRVDQLMTRGNTMKQTNRRRAAHPKKRTGCVTCKIRRVKCDETRPICIRCQKLGRNCGGYLPEKAELPPLTKEDSPKGKVLKTLRPKGYSASQLLLEPSTALFESELEHRYFVLFSDKIASEISPYFNPDLWSRMILQACAAEHSIRNAAIAIGALGKTFETAKEGYCPMSGKKLVNDNRLPSPGTNEPKTYDTREVEEVVQRSISHHRYALEQYDKAIKGMREYIKRGNQSLRTTLIACIVRICFEALHGNHDLAIYQLQSGIALLQDWKVKQRDASKHPLGFSSPSPDTVEDFLVQVFGRMEIQTMATFDSRPPENHAALKVEGKDVIEQMPERFGSIEQARIYIDLIMRRLMHFIAALDPSPLSFSMSSEHSNRHLRHPVQGLQTIDDRYLMWMEYAHRSGTPLLPATPSDVLAEHDALTKELPTWNTAFSPLLADVLQATANIRDRISALTMQIAALTSHICIHAAFFTLECSYDIFLPDFKQILEYSTLLLEAQEKESRKRAFSGGGSGTLPGIAFAFEIGVIPPLYLTATKCRHRTTRKGAIDLLEKYPRRESVWDTIVMVAVSKWTLQLEEGELDDTFGSRSSDEDDIVLPEERRVRKVSIKFDLVGRRAKMSCLCMDGETGGWIERRNTHTW